MEAVANAVRIVGFVLTIAGLWSATGGLRVVVSGRVDERRRSADSLKRGLPLLVCGVAMLLGGTWLANWARMP